MKYTYEIMRDEKLGMIIVEFIDNQKNAQWELEICIELIKNPNYKHKRINKVCEWLRINHPELLI